MENRPGALAEVVERLAKDRINIEGISATGTADVGLVQLVTSHPKKTERILRLGGIPYTVQDIVIVKMKNKPGSLYEMISKLSRSKININYVYGTACTCKMHGDSYVIVSSPDLARTEAVCRRI